MKKVITLALFLMLSCGVARADIFGEQPSSREGLYGASIVDADTILGELTQILGYLSPRVGSFYDVNGEEFTTLLSATLYTIPNTGVALGVGVTNADGVVGSIEYNVGTHIPADDVPLLNLFEYLYVGVAGGMRYLDEEGTGSETWEFAWGPTLIFKTTF